MNANEKCEFLKDTIFQLYSKEGRPFSYISKLLKINRKNISEKIKEWNFPLPESKKHLSPSKQKLLNKYKNLIISRFNNDVKITLILKETKLDSRMLIKFCEIDEDLKEARDKYKERIRKKTLVSKEKSMQNSSYDYDFEDLENEIWKDILNYPGYMVSNMGRIKSYKKEYKKYMLLKLNQNTLTNRVYVSITNPEGKRKNLNVSRLVAHAFIEGYSEEKNTVNHKDGDVTNNKSSNLEWTTQSENNTHSYRSLGRKKIFPNDKKYFFKKILYKNKYEFKTISAFTRFIGKSPTQIRRYLDNPEKHEIKLIK